MYQCLETKSSSSAHAKQSLAFCIISCCLHSTVHTQYILDILSLYRGNVNLTDQLVHVTSNFQKLMQTLGLEQHMKIN